MDLVWDILIYVPSFWGMFDSFKQLHLLTLTCKRLSNIQNVRCCWANLSIPPLPKRVLQNILGLSSRDLLTVPSLQQHDLRAVRLMLWQDALNVALRKHHSVQQMLCARERARRRRDAVKETNTRKFVQKSLERDKRMHDIKEELAVLQLSPTGSMYTHFVAGGVPHPAAQVAQEIAWQYYVSRHLRSEYNSLIEQLRNEVGIYYHGIHLDARRLIRQRFPRPQQWPWLV